MSLSWEIKSLMTRSISGLLSATKHSSNPVSCGTCNNSSPFASCSNNPCDSGLCSNSWSQITSSASAVVYTSMCILANTSCSSPTYVTWSMNSTCSAMVARLSDQDTCCKRPSCVLELCNSSSSHITSMWDITSNTWCCQVSQEKKFWQVRLLGSAGTLIISHHTSATLPRATSGVRIDQEILHADLLCNLNRMAHHRLRHHSPIQSQITEFYKRTMPRNPTALRWTC